MHACNTKRGTRYYIILSIILLIERIWYIATREPFDTHLDRNHLAFAPRGITQKV